jgi:hypothetical protein
MPTGYTEIIERRDDLTFREFALRCARGMGACIHQRDEGMDVLPRAEEPRPQDSRVGYHVAAKAKGEARLNELRGMSHEQARALWRAEREKAAHDNEESLRKCAALEEKYMAMRDAALAWNAPSPEHEGLRRFMLEQIDTCKSDWTPYLREVAPTPGDWLAENIREEEKSVAWHQKVINEENAKPKGMTSKVWIDLLYASL